MLTAEASRTRRRQHGLSIVELMVGVAVGLFVVAAASMLVATQLSDNRRLTLETQVQQDLRATADIITRELRRAGHWGNAARDGVWYPGKAAPVLGNPFSTVAKADDGSAFAGGDVSPLALLRYDADEDGALDSAEQLGFRLDNGVIQTRLGDAGWQALTDGNTLRITDFRLTMNIQPIWLECPKPCPGPGECRPRLQVRDITVDITGQAAHDNSVSRSLSSTVRLRNDAVIAGTCPA